MTGCSRSYLDVLNITTKDESTVFIKTTQPIQYRSAIFWLMKTVELPKINEKIISSGKASDPEKVK